MRTLQRTVKRVLRVGVCMLLAWVPVASQPTHVPYWVSQLGPEVSSNTYAASFYGVAEASYQLGELYWYQQHRAEALEYYRRAVAQGSAEAAFRLATYIPSQRQRWLRKAAALGHYEAILATVAVTLRTDPQRAQQQLQVIARALDTDERRPQALKDELPPEFKHELRQKLTQILFNHPWLETQLRWSQLHPDNEDWRDRVQLAEQLETGSYNLVAHQPCYFTIALLSSGGDARSTLYQWINKLKAHPLAEVGLCFTEYSSPLDCRVTRHGHLDCTEVVTDTDARVEVVDLDTLVDHTRASNSTARVLNTTMSISSAAEFAVFVHELGHLLGLADEYAMSAPLAHAFCSGQYQFSALNVVVTSAREVSRNELDALIQRVPWAEYLQQPIAQQAMQVDDDEAVLILGSQDESKIGLFATDTCAGTPYFAWRPVAEPTFMQQHEVGSIPEFYVRLIRNRLQNEE